MNNPNASSLFHFTDSFENLKAIIRDGIRFSYSYEEYDFENIPQDERPDFKGVAIPMICFCNTPLSRVENHARVYGKYHIAFDKEFLMDTLSPILNPVIYYSSENLARSIFCLKNTNEFLRSLFSELISTLYGNEEKQTQKIINILTSKNSIETKLDKLPYNIKKGMISCADFSFASNFILGLCKPIFGLNKLGEKTYLDEEREWRAFMIDRFDDDIEWGFYDCKEDFETDKKNLGKKVLKSKYSHLTLPSIEWSNMVTSICVEYENQIPQLVDYILSSDFLLGFAINKENDYIRSYVLSRITSFERLSRDI